jgi:hypothetical protein
VAVQDVTYDWDAFGNLKSRWNQSSNIGRTAKKNLQEIFCYDELNRLIKSHQGTLTGSCSIDQEYDGLGNITRKTGVGNYTYGSKAGPHTVTSTTNDGAYDNGFQRLSKILSSTLLNVGFGHKAESTRKAPSITRHFTEAFRCF